MPGRTLPNLGLTGFWPLGEDGWNDDNDANLLKLSVLVQGGVIDKVAALPTDPAPSNGDTYILDENDATNPNAVAIRDDGAWVYVTPSEGWLIYNRTANYYEKFDGTTWAEFVTGSGGGGLPDAPSDGNLYARRDGAWESFTAGGGTAASGGPSAALVLQKSANQSFSGTGWDAVTFDATPLYDSTGSIFDGTDSFTAPAGAVAMEVNFRCNWENTTSGSGRYVRLSEVGGATLALDISSDLNETGQTMNTGVVPCTAGQAYAILANSGNGSGVDMSGTGFGGPAALTVRFYDAYGDLIGGSGGSAPATSSPTPVIEKTGGAENLRNSDQGSYARHTFAGAKTLTVRPEATEALTANGEWHIRNAAASGDLTIVEGTGVTVNPPFGGSLVLSPGMGGTLKRVGADEFDLIAHTVAA